MRKLVIVLGVAASLWAGCTTQAAEPTPTFAPVPTPTITPVPTATFTPTPAPNLDATETAGIAATIEAYRRKSFLPLTIIYATPRRPSPSLTSSGNQGPIRIVPSLDYVYYLVSGGTEEDFFDSARSNGLNYDAAPGDWVTTGLTKSDRSLETEYATDGDSCRLQSANIHLKFVVTLPRHSNLSSLSNLQLSRWQAFEGEVSVHEQRHVDIYTRGMEALKKTLESLLTNEFPDCDSAKSSIASAWELQARQTEQEQDAFHLSEGQP